MGHLCEDTCPEGYYGLHCIETCQCKTDKFVCHVSNGCVCRQGYRGENCDEAVVGKYIDDSERSGKWETEDKEGYSVKCQTDENIGN